MSLTRLIALPFQLPFRFIPRRVNRHSEPNGAFTSNPTQSSEGSHFAKPPAPEPQFTDRMNNGRRASIPQSSSVLGLYIIAERRREKWGPPCASKTAVRNEF